jgi:photosystem II stability/assembly factor-like uncharacterized protein
MARSTDDGFARRRRRRAIAQLVILAFVTGAAASGGTAAAADPAWRSIGPAPPAIEAAVVADAPSRTIYVAGVGGGVLKSTDGGRGFVPANGDMTTGTVLSMAMPSGQPDVVYVGTDVGILKTVDGGVHWRNLGGSSGAVTLAIDPVDPNVIYAGSSPNGGVIRSDDGGATWTSGTGGGFGVPPTYAVAIDPADTRIVYAGTAGAGAWKSVDRGRTWTRMALDTTVWALLVDRNDDRVVYAGTNGDGVWRSSDRGATWMRAGSPEVGVVLGLAKIGDRLYAGTATQGVSVSTDEGATWRRTRAARGLALVLSVDAEGSLYLGTNAEGALVLPPRRGRDRDGERGGDDRREWRRLAWPQLRACACQNGHAIAVDPADHRHVLLSTNDGGLLVTRDGGRHWRDGGVDGLVARGPRGIGFDPQDSRYVYVGGFTGMGFFRSADGGRHWERRVFGSAAMYTTGVSVDPVDHSVYVATLSGDGVWKSTDYGDTFRRIDRAPGAAPGVFLGLTGRGITVDPQRSGVVFAAASRGRTAGIWRSLDAGATWTQVNPTPALSVTVDPTDSRIVYAATQKPSVLKSVDGGATFVVTGSGLPSGVQTSRTGSVQVDPRNPAVLYVGTEGVGVYRSLDGGGTWSSVSDGLLDRNVFGLALDPVSPDRLYAATAASVFATGSVGRGDHDDGEGDRDGDREDDDSSDGRPAAPDGSRANTR